MLVMVVVDLEPDPQTLVVRPKHTLDGTPINLRTLHTFSHLHQFSKEKFIYWHVSGRWKKNGEPTEKPQNTHERT